MVKEVRYKGEIVNLDDIEVTWSDYVGKEMKGTIDDYGISERDDAWAECEAGEGW